MRYRKTVRPKLAVWLLATIVVMSSGWNIPVTTRTTTQAAYSIVCLTGVSDRRTIPNPALRHIPQRPPSVFSSLTASAPALPGLNRTLFQRPPPTSLRPRI
jgi:hypothetical protein